MDPSVAVANSRFREFLDTHCQYGLLGSMVLVPVACTGKVNHRTGSSFRNSVTTAQISDNFSLLGRP